MSTYKNYIDRFNRSKSQKRDNSSEPKNNPDKEAYTQFLEVQLERISQAILHMDTFNDKIEAVSSQVHSLEEKLNNSNKLVKLLQSFADGQEADNIKVQEKLAELSKKSNERASVVSDSRYAKEEDVDNLYKRLESLEKRVERTSKDNTRAYSSVDNLSEYQSEVPKEKLVKDLEQKAMEVVNSKIEACLKNFKNLEERIEEQNDKFSEDIATDIKTLENRMSEFINRAGERFPYQITGFNDRALNDIKEDFYQKIEGVMDELKNMPTLLEVEEIKTLLEKEVVERKDALEQIEKYLYLNEKQSTNMTEDVTQKLDEFETKLQDFELMISKSSPRVTEKGEVVNSFPEKKLTDEIRKLQSAVKDLYGKADQSPKKVKPFSSSSPVKQSTKDEMYELEKRVTDSMVDGFDRFSKMIKKHMDKAKKFEKAIIDLDERVGVLEESLPSRSREKEKRHTSQKPAIHSEEETPKSLLQTKENPFLRGRLASGSKFETLQVENSPQKKDIAEGETSFGNRFAKLKSSQKYETNQHHSDLESSKNNKRERRKNRRSRSSLRSRSRSVSAKSLNGSFLSSRSGKENKSPGLRGNNAQYSRKNSGKKSQDVSPSASASATPKRRRSAKSPESFVSVQSQKKRGSENATSGRGSTTIQVMQNKIEMERKQREEKIKKLLKNPKPSNDTPKFQPKEGQGGSAKVNKAVASASGTKPGTKSAKNKNKI